MERCLAKRCCDADHTREPRVVGPDRFATRQRVAFCRAGLDTSTPEPARTSGVIGRLIRGPMPAIAILDDYQGVAREFVEAADPALGELSVFRDHLADEDALAARLAPFEVIVAMRERTPF